MRTEVNLINDLELAQVGHGFEVGSAIATSTSMKGL